MAIPTFSDYVYKSRATEATEFLGVIRLREESYRSEFGTYCPTLDETKTPDDVTSLDDPANLVPDPKTTGREQMPFVPNDQWHQLGATPSGPVRFGYGVAAGDPSTAPAKLGFTPDFWWVARAVGNLDGDGTFVMFETYSGSKGIFIGDFSTKDPIAKGWE
ncbi:MAG TPA: hypothetical protein VJR89_17385 [Polyangiales bacterium]|nr:hypothetical protein [Polyangiales bacterium]